MSLFLFLSSISLGPYSQKSVAKSGGFGKKDRKEGDDHIGDSLVVKTMDFQSRGSLFKTNGWLQGQLNLSSFRGRSNEYQEFLGTLW